MPNKAHRTRRYLPPKGAPVAVAPKAWDSDFEVLVFGEGERPPAFEREGSYAVVSINGPLCQHPGWWDSYDDIRSRVGAAFASSQEAVCLRVDSPGGDYTGAIEIARDLRTMADAAGKPLVAFVDGAALSAAYALACASDEIVITPSAHVGSVGVWCALVDVTAQDKMFGQRIAIIASGSAKADRHPHVPMTDEAIDRLRAQVDEMAGQFFDLVSDRRGIDARPLEGADVFGASAVDDGLADRVVNSWAAFLTSQGTQMSKYDEAMGALKRAAEGDDEDAKRAKRALKMMEESESDDKKDKDEDGGPGPGKREEKAAAQAVALRLAEDLQRAQARIAALEDTARAESETRERDALLAKRPDFTPSQREFLASCTTDQVRKAVETWERVHVQPGASASATTPSVTGGEDVSRTAAARSTRLTPEQQRLLTISDPNRKAAPSQTPRVRGTSFAVGYSDAETAKARLAALKGQLAQVNEEIDR